MKIVITCNLGEPIEKFTEYHHNIMYNDLSDILNELCENKETDFSVELIREEEDNA